MYVLLYYQVVEAFLRAPVSKQAQFHRRRAARGRYNRATAAAEGVSSFSWPPFEAAYFFSEFTVRASTPLLQLLVLVSRAGGSWQKHSRMYAAAAGAAATRAPQG